MGFEVKNKVALVTGANRGIGRVLVQRLLEAGVSRVYAAVRDPSTMQDLESSAGGRLTAIELDLRKPELIKQAAVTANDVELVINNAGVLKAASPLASDAIDSLDCEIDVNVKGLVRMAQAFAPVLRSNGGGALVQMNSVASLRSFADFATYSASKAAAYSVTQALRDLLSSQGTHVVSVHPGPIATDMANAAGLGEVAESPIVVADAILAALANGEFHAFPDSMAQQVGTAYQTFAEAVVEANVSEAGAQS